MTTTPPARAVRQARVVLRAKARALARVAVPVRRRDPEAAPRRARVEAGPAAVAAQVPAPEPAALASPARGALAAAPVGPAAAGRLNLAAGQAGGLRGAAGEGGGG